MPTTGDPHNACGITIFATNKTGQGPITFNSLNTLSNFSVTGFPPCVANSLPADGNPYALLSAAMNQLSDTGSQGSTPVSSPSAGTVIFNFPNGEPLTITWDLDAWNGGKDPVITASEAYAVTGLTSPERDGSTNFIFTYRIVISVQ